MIFIRLVLTAVIAIAAVFCGLYVWDQVFRDPWTRDAHVRANLVRVAPQVSGAVTEVPVANNASVQAGDLLFRIDDASYRLALAQAEANLANAKATAANARQQADRLKQIQDREALAVAAVNLEEAELQADAADADVKAAEAQLSKAQLDLSRCEVRAPVAGQVTNLGIHIGDYASTGTAAMTLIDTGSFRVDAFFMETQIDRIAVGDAARIRLMANGEELTGTVTGIASGISYAQDTSSSLLQAPEPSFQWIRLAQRIPVEIALTSQPARIGLANGLTVTARVAAED
ncbi:HlyD family secretion protein [Falsirhodobacter algicola]|uniref:Efflux RND transporter periplasmic adaptor subunit n=1 Tax=Falsirhodobacter algicola TaxID=2692330 RepID=A0A8J8MQQ8_9RHOB|nr:HlyD family secretion protein [Falsirhodobacter algicola]QUS34906.1 efflux RND transporter periplasmic adaptor subunit [Falsirhodobacter algicola]